MAKGNPDIAKHGAATRFVKGHVTNPNGPVRVAKIVIDAGFDPKELRAEIVQRCVAAMRELDPGSKSEGPNWRFAVQYLGDHLLGKPKERLELSTTLTDEQRAEELRILATETLAALPIVDVEAVETPLLEEEKKP
jgi:hypothetical protein